MVLQNNIEVCIIPNIAKKILLISKYEEVKIIEF